MRLDQRLVELGLAESRARAKALVEAGAVTVGGVAARKPSQAVPDDAGVVVSADPNPWVSRAALKLIHALDAFGLTPQGVALDVGASTGGFTEVLLAHGAEKVFAVDVGHGQLAWSLRQDPRVVVLERTNARHLGPEDLGERPDWVVIDASFIGLEKLLPAARAILSVDGEVVALVKPQFQVGQDKVGKGGVVRDPELRREATATVAADAEGLGFALIAQEDCVITGPKGNQETFIWLRRSEAHAPRAPARPPSTPD